MSAHISAGFVSLRRALHLLLFLACTATFAVARAEEPSVGGKAARDVVLVLDNSGSMHRLDRQFQLRSSVLDLLPKLDANLRVGLVIFDTAVNLSLPLTSVGPEHQNKFSDGLHKLNYRGRYTDTAAGIERALYELKSQGRTDATHAIVLLTDGVIDTGNAKRSEDRSRWLRGELSDDAAQNNIPIYTIAFGEQADFELLHILAEKSHGNYVRVNEAGQLGETLTKMIDAVQAPPVATPAPTVQATTVPDEVAAAIEAPSVVPTEEVHVVQAQAEAARQEQDALEVSPVPLAAPTEAAPTPEVAEPETSIYSSANEWWSRVTSGQADWAKDFPFHWVLAATVAIALLEVLLYLRRRRAIPKYRPEPPLYPPSSVGATPLAEAEVPEAFLQDMSGVMNNQSFRISSKWTLVGRQRVHEKPGVDELIIESPTVGREHAAIEFRDQGFWLRDRRSRNGTFVNGERISTPVLLKHGDLIRFHDFEFRFTLGCLNESDETVVAGVLPDWAKARSDTASWPSLIQQDAVVEETPTRAKVPRRSASKTDDALLREAEELFDDITLPSDEAVKKALDKYFETTRF